MNTNAKKALILVVALVAVIGGSTLLYQKLGTGQPVLSEDGPAATQPQTEPDTTQAAPNAAPTETDATQTEPQTEKPDETKPDTQANTAPDENTVTAPDFSVTDAEGNTVKLSDLRGKPVVLNFWASWCPPCKAEMPDFQAVQTELADTVQFMMVNMTDGSRETEQTARQFIAEQGYTFPIYFDNIGANEAANAYQVNSIPTTYFIDSAGNLITYRAGMMDEATLRRGIAKITE